MIVKYTANFLKQLKKSDVRIRKAFKQRLLIFIKNPNDLELNNHPLEKEYTGFRSIDITADYRAVYKEVVQEDDIYVSFSKENSPTVYFTSFGTHTQLYGE